MDSVQSSDRTKAIQRAQVGRLCVVGRSVRLDIGLASVLSSKLRLRSVGDLKLAQAVSLARRHRRKARRTLAREALNASRRQHSACFAQRGAWCVHFSTWLNLCDLILGRGETCVWLARTFGCGWCQSMYELRMPSSFGRRNACERLCNRSKVDLGFSEASIFLFHGPHAFKDPSF